MNVIVEIMVAYYLLVNDTGSVRFDLTHRRQMSSDNEGMLDHSLKILVGSVGSKSNKVLYVKELLRFLSQHSNLSKSVLWTPATTRVAALYAAADAYIINSQVILLHSLSPFASFMLLFLF